MSSRRKDSNISKGSNRSGRSNRSNRSNRSGGSTRKSGKSNARGSKRGSAMRTPGNTDSSAYSSTRSGGSARSSGGGRGGGKRASGVKSKGEKISSGGYISNTSSTSKVSLTKNASTDEVLVSASAKMADPLDIVSMGLPPPEIVNSAREEALEEAGYGSITSQSSEAKDLNGNPKSGGKKRGSKREIDEKAFTSEVSTFSERQTTEDGTELTPVDGEDENGRLIREFVGPDGKVYAKERLAPDSTKVPEMRPKPRRMVLEDNIDKVSSTFLLLLLWGMCAICLSTMYIVLPRWGVYAYLLAPVALGFFLFGLYKCAQPRIRIWSRDKREKKRVEGLKHAYENAKEPTDLKYASTVEVKYLTPLPKDAIVDPYRKKKKKRGRASGGSKRGKEQKSVGFDDQPKKRDSKTQLVPPRVVQAQESVVPARGGDNIYGEGHSVSQSPTHMKASLVEM